MRKRNNMWLAFDVDGTIFSSENILVKAYQKSIEQFNKDTSNEFNLRIPKLDEILKLIGLPTAKILEIQFPNVPVEKRGDIGLIVLDTLAQSIRNHEGTLYNGIKEVIEELYNEGYQLVIASNGRSKYINAILETYDLVQYFVKPLFTVSSRSFTSKGDLVKGYIEHHSVNPKDMIMIGDRKSDLDAAVEASTHFIGCAYGHTEDGELDNVRFIAKSVAELPSIIRTVDNDVHVSIFKN